VNRSLWLLALCGAAGLGHAQEPAAKPAGNKSEAVLFESLPVVEAVSLHAQTLIEAPASVTVITDEQIRRRGYRTLAEALTDARGLYVTYDRAYRFVGVRGFSLQGDYNTRFLVMINGHSLSENIYGSAGYFAQDFGLDMELIKRIEIIRGPSSALYGSNGMFATINIVTKSPVEYEPVRVSAETDSFGERKVSVSSSQYLGRGANLLVSASMFNNAGQSLYFPSFDSPETNHGLAVDMDGEKGYHTFANLIWRDWSFLAYFNDREKLVPTGWYSTVFNGRGTKVSDGRGFIESAYQHEIGAHGQLRWRLYYDQYRYTGRYDFAGLEDDRDGAKGDWLSSQLTYRFALPRLGTMTVGTEASWDLRALQTYAQVSPLPAELLRIDRKNRSLAAFFQDEYEISRRWKLYVGGRLDHSRYDSLSITPRIALVYQPSPTSAIKLLYGRSFRDPTAFEQFYDDSGSSQIPNPLLRPERMQTVEAVFERAIGKRLQLSANVYRYRLQNLITAAPLTDGVQQYRNVDRICSNGVELEAKARLGSRLNFNASLTQQNSTYDAESPVRVNSPARVGILSLQSPMWSERLNVSATLQYLSQRMTFAGGFVPPVYLVNLAFANRRFRNGTEMQFGVRNLLDRRYWDPSGLAEDTDRIQQNGRNVYLRLSWSPRRETASGTAPNAQP
jgi:outer membrane receptor protein involved in Fe transport